MGWRLSRIGYYVNRIPVHEQSVCVFSGDHVVVAQGGAAFEPFSYLQIAILLPVCFPQSWMVLLVILLVKQDAGKSIYRLEDWRIYPSCDLIGSLVAQGDYRMGKTVELELPQEYVMMELADTLQCSLCTSDILPNVKQWGGTGGWGNSQFHSNFCS